MEIFTELNENNNLSLALGYFDGVHIGHQNVIASAVEYAKSQNKKSAVITFKDHPCCFLWGICPKYILTREDRRKHIAELGVDFLYELDFGEISKLSAEDYFKEIILKYFSPVSISTGFNHRFGANKSGDTNLLREFSKKYGYKYFEIEPVKYDDIMISSTNIRTLLSEGHIEAANSELGYEFSIEGEVVQGQKLGRTIGFRTANIIYPPELIDLPFGVYSTIVKIANKTYKSITNFGIRPTVSNTNVATLESHILDFDEDIYGETIRVNFLKMIRQERKFCSLDELKNQIVTDIKLCNL